MQDADLLLSLAEIAGVFVGFGALIAVRTGGASGAAEVAYMRSVVSMGMLTVVAALAPVTLDRYDLSAHQVWVASGLLVLVGWVTMFIAMARTPEYRENVAAEFAVGRAARSGSLVVVEAAVLALYLLAIALALVGILLGLQPELDAALYVSVVVLILLGAGWSLLTLVFARRSPASG